MLLLLAFLDELPAVFLYYDMNLIYLLIFV